MGDYEPTEEESTWTYDVEDEDEDEEEESQVKIEQVDETKKEPKSEPMEAEMVSYQD